MKTSEQINELAAALVTARKAFAPLKKAHTAKVRSAKGDYEYQYSTLDDLYEATTMALCDAGIFPLQNVETGTNAVGITTLLMHQSGQFLQTDPVWMPVGQTPQSVGSAITFGRRYSLSAALGVAAEDDDDGQGAKPEPKAAAKPAPPKALPAPTSPAPAPGPGVTAARAARVISESQRKRLFAIAKKNHWSEPDIKALIATHGYESSKDISVGDYDAIVEALETGEVLPAREPGSDDDSGAAPWEQEH